MKYLIFFIALLPISSYSQPVITSSVFPPDGSILELVGRNQVDVQENNIGANITWDFSQLDIPTDTLNLFFDESEGSAYDSLFPEANKVSIIFFGQDSSFQYHSLTDFEWELQGSAFGSTPTLLAYSNAETITKFPVTFEDTWIDSFAFKFGSSDIEFMGTGIYEVDGYGTLILPNGTYDNVIRIHKIWSTPGWNDEVHKYFYYSPDYYYSLLRMNKNEADTYYQTNPISIVTSSIEEDHKPDKVKISPNPISTYFELKIELETESTVDIKVYSINGQNILSKSGVEFKNGVHYLKIEKYLESGYYVIQLVVDEIIYNKKILVQ